MKKTLIIVLVSLVMTISACAPARSAGLMEIEPVGKDPNLIDTAKVNLINDTNTTLYFRMIDVYSNVAIGPDIQLNPKQTHQITPNANQYYNYIVFTNNNDKEPVYSYNNAIFNAGYTYSFHYAAAVR